MRQGSRSLITPWVLCFIFSLLIPAALQAQNWSWDARRIGMGGSSSSGNLAGKMIEEQRNYTSIVLPLGFSQVFSDTSRFDATCQVGAASTYCSAATHDYAANRPATCVPSAPGTAC